MVPKRLCARALATAKVATEPAPLSAAPLQIVSPGARELARHWLRGAPTTPRLAATLGDWSGAEHHFEEAVRINQGLAAPHLVAQAQRDFGSALIRRGRARDVRRANQLLDR